MIASLSRGSLLDEVLHGGYNEQQLAAYVSWVNSQLKRKLGLQPIGDLRRDLQDGVVLVQLIEIVAGEVLQGVYTPSLNKEESRKNVEEVLKFISSRNIRMPRISAKDIVDGNLKSIMRIILALAAHFKPSASQRAAALGGRSLTRGNTTHNPLSTVALAQGAAAALASARLDASLPIRFARINRYASVYKLVSHVRLWVFFQSLLLHGSLPEDEQDVSLTLEPVNTEQQLVGFSLLDLFRELLLCKQEIRNLQAVKEAQQQRLCTQEASILQMKQELLRASMTKDELNIHHVGNTFRIKNLICLLYVAGKQKDVGQKDRLLQQFKHKLEESQKLQCVLVLLCQQAEEVQLLRDALRSLRNNFRDHDPQHHTLDTLEQGIVSLIDRLHVVHTHRVSHLQTNVLSCQSQNGSPSSTKILYFTGKSPTPSMINIPKRLGEVTLKDVKEAVDREGNYRYHFKALDPEFGTVKEEVFLDGAIVPGWEGKIVAWLEEDHGDER
uniref:Uncharacterized protein n=1 Tax=Xiphophorus couchianus TaxID=32473 RepID=A0A3B5MPL7_9TELE